MRRFLWLSLAALLLAGIVVSSSGAMSQAEARWVATDLGTLGGDDRKAHAINEQGQVVGWSETGAEDTYGNQIQHAFLWESGKMRDLGALPHLGLNQSAATALNSRGQVVGCSYVENRDGDVTRLHAVLWQEGKATDLGRVPLDECDGGWEPGERSALINDAGQIVVNGWRGVFIWRAGNRTPVPKVFAASDINARGQIIGVVGTPIPARPVLWWKGKMRTLGTLGGKGARPNDINDRGQIVGRSALKNGAGHAFLWENGKMVDLGTFGGSNSDADALNESGQVVGTADTKAKDKFGYAIWRPFIWQKGKKRDLGSLGGGMHVVAINDGGLVVGWGTTADDSRAFVWQNGTLTDLGTELSHAADVNERGWVVGDGYLKGYGYEHAVLWTPKR